MDIKYGFSPIIEAICEFRFEPNQNWDLTTPGILYEKIKERFPLKEQKAVFPTEIQINLKNPPSQIIKQTSQILFYTENKKNSINVGLNSIAIHCLKPYPKWDVFKPNIEFAYKGLSEIVNDLQLKRIGLRYVNEIEIDKAPVDLEKYFKFRPFLGEGLPGEVQNFIVGCESRLKDGQDLCRYHLTSSKGTDKTTNFTLDIDYFINEQDFSKVEPLDWVDNAHKEISNIFEGSITEELRDLFKEKAKKK